MCAKLRTVAASNNRDHASQSLLLLLACLTYIMVLFFAHIPFVLNHTINATPPERLQQHPLLFTTNRTDRTFFVWRLNSARPSHPGHNTILLRSEIPSGICTKLRNVAASNNRDHVSQSLLLLLARLNIWCYSSRTSRSWWITQSTQHHWRGCNTGIPFWSDPQEEPGSGLTASVPVSSVSALVCTNGVWLPLQPVSVAQNKPLTMLSSNVQSIDLMECTSWRFWMMSQWNGCSTPGLRSSVAFFIFWASSSNHFLAAMKWKFKWILVAVLKETKPNKSYI